MAAQLTHFLGWYIPDHAEIDWDNDTKVHLWIKELDAFMGASFDTVRTGALDTHYLSGWKSDTFKFAGLGAEFQYISDYFDVESGVGVDDIPGVVFKNGFVGTQPESGHARQVAGFVVDDGSGPGEPDIDDIALGGFVDFDNDVSVWKVGEQGANIDGILYVEGATKRIILDSTSGLDLDGLKITNSGSAPVHKDLTAQVGDVDPSVFVTPTGYLSGSLIVYKNGVAQRPGVSGNISETDPGAGEFTFTAGTPVSGESVSASYIPI